MLTELDENIIGIRVNRIRIQSILATLTKRRPFGFFPSLRGVYPESFDFAQNKLHRRVQRNSVLEWTLSTYSTTCKFRAILAPLTSTTLWLMTSCVVIPFAAKARNALCGQM